MQVLHKAGNLARAPNMVPAVRPAITDHSPTVSGACCNQQKAPKPAKHNVWISEMKANILHFQELRHGMRNSTQPFQLNNCTNFRVFTLLLCCTCYTKNKEHKVMLLNTVQLPKMFNKVLPKQAKTSTHQCT